MLLRHDAATNLRSVDTQEHEDPHMSIIHKRIRFVKPIVHCYQWPTIGTNRKWCQPSGSIGEYASHDSKWQSDLLDMEWNQILYLKPPTYKLPRYRPIYLFHLQEITSGFKPPSSLYWNEFDFLRRFKGLKSEKIQKVFW